MIINYILNFQSENLLFCSSCNKFARFIKNNLKNLLCYILINVFSRDNDSFCSPENNAIKKPLCIEFFRSETNEKDIIILLV